MGEKIINQTRLLPRDVHMESGGVNMIEVRNTLNKFLRDGNKKKITSPSRGDLVFDFYTGTPGIVLESYEIGTSNVLWSNRLE